MSKQGEPKVSFTFSTGDGQLDRIRFNVDGRMEFFGRDGRPFRIDGVERSVIHHGPGKPRMRSLILQSGHTVSFDGARALTSYDDVLVIDTAYIPGAQDPIAAAVAVRLRVREKGEQLVVTADDHCVIYLLRNYIGNPEFAAVYAMACDSKFASRARARAIVNDSDRGLHDAINARTLPVYNGCMLPAPFTLMYAGDKGYEVLNRVLKFCDKQSRKSLNAYFSGELPNPHRFDAGPPGSGDLRVNRLIQTDLQILNNASPIGALPDGMTMDLIGQDADGNSYKLAEAIVRDGQLHLRSFTDDIERQITQVRGADDGGSGDR